VRQVETYNVTVVVKTGPCGFERHLSWIASSRTTQICFAIEAPVIVPAQKIEELWIVSAKGLRSPAVIRADPVLGAAAGHRFPGNVPLGPHGFGPNGRLAMLDALKEWSKSYGDGGAFSTTFAGGLDKAALRGNKGARLGFSCSCFGKPPRVTADYVRTKRAPSRRTVLRQWHSSPA
jgi:hypothetical protein